MRSGPGAALTNRQRGRAIRGLAAVAVLACSALPEPAPNAAAAPARATSSATFSLNGLTFRYPSTWHVYSGPKPLTMFSYLIAYAGSMPIGDPCPPPGYSQSCVNPLTSLPRRGVFVSWTLNSFPGWTIHQIRGKRLRVAGHVGRLRIYDAREGYCPAYTQVSMYLAIAFSPPKTGAWYGMSACLRGPGLAKERKQVMRMVKSVRITEPGNDPTSSQATVDGVQLRLSLPHRVYPRNALAKATVRITNLTSKRRYLEDYPYGCDGTRNPDVQVVDGAGTVVYPPAFPAPRNVSISCDVPLPATLWPHQTVTRHVYLILRGASIRASLPVETRRVMVSNPTPNLVIPPITVQLTSGTPAPRVTVHPTRGGARAVFTRPAGAHGHLRWQSRLKCSQSVTQGWTAVDVAWEQSAGRTASFSCVEEAPGSVRVRQWQLIGGWLNYPVARISYRASAASSHVRLSASQCPVGSQTAITCYPPSQLKRVERLLPVKPIDPSPAVTTVTGLPLTLLLTAKRIIPKPSKHIIYLDYAYGNVPFDQIDTPQPATPAWADVADMPQHVKGLRGMHFWRDETNNVKGTWHLEENLRGHKLSVQIDTNQDKATLRALGQAVIDEARASNHAVIVRSGVRITASVARRTYPRNALVPVRIGLRNVSRHTVYVPFACRGPSNPNLMVLTSGGRQVFPPLIPVAAPPGPVIAACKAPRPYPLGPGKALSWTQDVVLRGPRIVVNVGLGRRTDYLGPTNWLTAHLRVYLTTPDPPTVTITSGSSVSVHVSNAPGTGPLLVSEWWLCPGDHAVKGAPERDLAPVTGDTITLPCAQPRAWHGIVGRLNHSVARFDYAMPPQVNEAPPAFKERVHHNNHLVPQGAVSVTIDVYQAPPVHEQESIIYQNAKKVSHLTQMLDGLPRRPSNIEFACPAYHTLWYYILHFGYRDTTSLDVIMGETCPPTAMSHGEVVGADQKYLRVVDYVKELVTAGGG